VRRLESGHTLMHDILEYLNILSAAGSHSAINDFTRVDGSSRSCLDHFFTRNKKQATGHIIRTAITDHFATALTLDTVLTDKKNLNKNHKMVTKIDDENLSAQLTNHHWTHILQHTDINLCVNDFMTTVNKYIDENTTHKGITNKTTKLRPWITAGLLNSIRHRDKMKQKTNKLRKKLDEPTNMENKTELLLKYNETASSYKKI